MQTLHIVVENVKCNGCAMTIRSGLGALPGVDNVEVDIAAQSVAVSGNALDRARIEQTLGALGYPVRAPLS